MKKSLPAIFASVLAAAALIGTLAGCDYEIELTSGPWPTSVPPVTTLPKTLPLVTTVPRVTVPETTPVTVPEVTTTPGTDIPYTGKYNPLLCTANADARAAEKGWICLNEYIVLDEYLEGLYGPLFDTKKNASAGVRDLYINSLTFDRPVEVYGIELTFVHPELESLEFAYGDLYISWFDLPYCPGIEIMENSNPLLPGNTLWLEAADGKALKRNGELSFYAYPDNIARVRFFGIAEPIIEEVRAPSYVPGDVTVGEYRTVTKYTLAYYSNSTGRLIVSFEQSTIYGSQKLPAGDIDLIQFAGREVVRIRYNDADGNVDLYWNDGEYRYNLFGSDEELLLRLAESIEPRFSTGLS